MIGIPENAGKYEAARPVQDILQRYKELQDVCDSEFRLGFDLLKPDVVYTARVCFGLLTRYT